MSEDTPQDEQKLTGKAASLANLKPIQPGEVRNPHGRGKGTLNRETIYRRLLEAAAIAGVKDEHRKILGDEMADAAETVADQIAAKDIILALSGDAGAIQRVFDNVNGKLAEKRDHSGSIGIGSVLDSLAKSGPDPLPSVPPSNPQAEPCKTKLPVPKLKPHSSNE